MGIYVNDVKTYVVKGASLNTTVSLSPGKYNTIVEEWDYCGGASVTHIDDHGRAVKRGRPPGVSVTSPVANSTVTSPVSYVATASTNLRQGRSFDGDLRRTTSSSTLWTRPTLNKR